jgi:hypothetical protein
MLLSRRLKAHTGFEPVLPENPAVKPGYGSPERNAAGSKLNPHLAAVLHQLEERDRQRRR